MSGRHIPRPQLAKSIPRPVAKQPVANDQFWSFSFKYFRQRDHFGIAQQKPSWFASLLGALGALSETRVEETQTNEAVKGHWRLHDINWDHEGVPLRRDEIDWIARDYRDNPEEFPILQFQISKAQGRVVGFFDEKWIFHILLLDPLHNIQPAADFDYRVRETHYARDDFALLAQKVDVARAKANCGADCPVVRQLNTVWDGSDTHIVYARVGPEDFASAKKCFEDGKAKCHQDVYDIGLIYLTSEQ